LTAESLQMPGAPSIDTGPENLFFDDGTVRIGGREYSAMVQSACYERGEEKQKLSCLSCHSMHDSDPDDQLARGREGDRACATCHEPARYGTTSHTHHAAGSLGGTCLGCHMPMTEYALLKSIRSHRIDSPKATDLARTDRPNACNLCHLDRSLAWSRSYLGAWYGQRASQQAPDGDVGVADAAGASWLLAGDPGERVLAAAAMGSPGPTGTDWRATLLTLALEDPYAAVRFVAKRSLRHLPTDSPGHVRAPMDPAILAALVAGRSPRALTLSE
jgi:hypothetical protein